ncbi:MAG: YicC family protein [Deltaproteobacteria bacterium]|nr:YicC family protein [Deltaproteobacteria bacterium]
MRSMTGYGAASTAVPGGKLLVEVRSVNARFLELRIALPREHQNLEAELRQLVQKSIDRGRVDVAIRREGKAERRAHVAVDLALAREVASAWRRVGRELRLAGELDLAFLRSAGSDVVRTTEEGPDVAKEAPAIRRTLRAALAAHERERRREGEHLERDMRARLQKLGKLRARCASLAAEMKPVLATRLQARIADLMGDRAPDPDRLVQEVAIALDRSDVSEELTRLESHLAALGELLGAKGESGKRIEFLLQELLREVNTIGSKANHLPLTQAVLEAKGEIEKLKEQVANVE